MQEQDRDRLDPLGDEGGGGLADFALVERQQHAAARIDPLADFAAQRARDQRHMLLKKRLYDSGRLTRPIS